MKVLTLQKKSITIAVCTFIMAMTGLFFDGTTNESFALTTQDCRTCHNDGFFPDINGDLYPIFTANHHNKERGCGSCHKNVTLGTPRDYNADPGHPDRDCLKCHIVETIVSGAVDVTTAHTPLHDMTNVPDPVTCNVSCHFPTVIDEHTKYPSFSTPDGGIDCDRCHKNTNTDPALGPINVQEQITIGSSTAVTPQEVTCEKCHTTIGDTGHAEAHDNVLPDIGGGCDTVGCHNSNVMLEHTDRGWSCDICHGNTMVISNSGALLSPQEIVEAAAGPFDPSSTRFCTDCHGSDAGNHAALHDQVSFLMEPSGQDNCTTCHEANPEPNKANLVAEHVSNQGLTCSTCHDGFDYSIPDPTTGDPIYYVIDTIEKGRTSPGFPGQPVYCIDCHRNDTLGQGAGHAPIRDEAEPWNTCRLCHRLTALGNDINLHNMHTNAAQSIGQDCSVCHVPQGTRPNCALCHSSDNWNNTGINLDIIGPGAEDHDFHFSPTGPLYNNGNPLCKGCHVNGVPGAEPLPVPYSECSNCHNGAIARDISYGSPVHTTHQSQANCSDCHSPAPNCLNCHPHNEFKGPNKAQHDLHTDTFGAECTDCHINGIPGSEPLPYPFNECSVCHNPVGNPDGIMGSDITYGSTIHTDSHITGGETYIPDGATSPLSCKLCHDPANPPTCSECHAPGHPPIPAPYNQCSNCHNGVPTDQTYNLTLGNIMFGELGHNVHMLKANNDCTVCHTAQPSCSTCHIPSHPSIPAPYNQCDQCHDTLQPGALTHNKHKEAATNTEGVIDCAKCHVPVGNVPNCGECHTGDANHETAHVNVGVPSPGCTTCHSADIVEEHLTNRPDKGYTCATCHDQQVVDLDPTVVYDAIHNNNGSVTCSDCHVGQNSHHETDNAKTGDCAYCHADPRLAVDANAPSGQLACRQCHIDSSGFVKTGTDKPSHAVNTNGNIQDFGACFACHQPEPYHAKPTSWPGWYEENQQAPGRGSFNLFVSEFRPDCGRRGDCEGTSYENRRNYGEDRSPSRDRGRQWESPAISYTMVTFYDHFNTKREWTVPTFGTGGGGGTTPPPSQNDSVNITRARYDSGNDELEVRADNSLGRDAQLTVVYDGRNYDMDWDGDEWRIKIPTSSCSDSTIEVVSAAGGSDSSSVENCSSSSWSWRR